MAPARRASTCLLDISGKLELAQITPTELSRQQPEGKEPPLCRHLLVAGDVTSKQSQITNRYVIV